MLGVRKIHFKPKYWLVAIITFGLVHGLIYVFLVPPWQHYDEPTHFEYAWLVANHPGLPKPGDIDPLMRRQVAVSMIEHGFYRDLGIHPTINEVASSIGYSQLDDPPLYYILASLPLRLLHNQDVIIQLYAVRLVSLFLYLLMILIAWGFIKELIPTEHPMWWMMPLSLAMLPGFTDLMTSVNNDAGAIVVFSFFLWVSVRLIKRGFSFVGLVSVFVATLLGYWMKNTAWFAIPLLPGVILFAYLRGKVRSILLILFLAALGIGFLAVFKWGDSADWYRRTFQTATTRIKTSQAPLGAYAFRLDLNQDGNNPSIQQPLTPGTVNELRNTKVTLGAWVWSNQAIITLMPVLSCDCGRQLQLFTTEIQVGLKPKFYMFSALLPENARYVWVALTSPAGLLNDNVHGTIFYDGLILVNGEGFPDAPPRFDDSEGKNGMWGGRAFSNLLRNPSAEQAGPGLQPWANKIGLKLIPAWPASFPSDIVVSLLDWEGSNWYYKETFTFLLRTFWAKFGWGNVALLGSKPYRILAFVTILGMAGAGWAVWKRRNDLPWDVILLLILALLGIWLSTIFRGIGSLFGWAYTPVARYTYPAILPTLMVLNLGWLQILYLMKKWSNLVPKVLITVYLLFFLSLDTLSILSIFRFFYLT